MTLVVFSSGVCPHGKRQRYVPRSAALKADLFAFLSMQTKHLWFTAAVKAKHTATELLNFFPINVSLKVEQFDPDKH